MFVYSLPLLFTELAIIQPAELLFILLGIYGILFISVPLPLPVSEWQQQRLGKYAFYQYLLTSWSGLMPVWQCFWPFFLLLNLSLFTADTLAKSTLLSVSSWDDVHMMLFFPLIWWGVAVWRCSALTQYRAWAAFARLLTLCAVFEFLLKAYIRWAYPRVFFNCQELLLDYSSCF